VVNRRVPRYEYVNGVVARPVEQPVRSWLEAAPLPLSCQGVDLRSHQAGELLLAETAAPAGTTSERAQALLEVLRRVVPFDGAFLAFADPLGPGYHSLVCVDLDARTVEFLSGPQVARDIEVTGTDRERPPLGPSDLPYPAEELPTWAECLIPSGIHEGLGVALFAPGGRHVGHLAVLSGSHRPRPPAAGSRASRRSSRTASTRCVHCSPPYTWCGGPRPACCSARTAAARRCRACRRMRC